MLVEVKTQMMICSKFNTLLVIPFARVYFPLCGLSSRCHRHESTNILLSRLSKEYSYESIHFSFMDVCIKRTAGYINSVIILKVVSI